SVQPVPASRIFPHQLGVSATLAAEAKIETSAHHTFGFFDIDEGRFQANHLRRERDLAGAEIEIIVFDEGRYDVREGIFAADTYGPFPPPLPPPLSHAA